MKRLEKASEGAQSSRCSPFEPLVWANAGPPRRTPAGLQCRDPAWRGPEGADRTKKLLIEELKLARKGADDLLVIEAYVILYPTSTGRSRPTRESVHTNIVRNQEKLVELLNRPKKGDKKAIEFTPVLRASQSGGDIPLVISYKKVIDRVAEMDESAFK